MKSGAYRDIREDFFGKVHLPMQKRLLPACALILVAVFVYLKLVVPGWQSTVTLIQAVLLVFFWIQGYRFSKEGKIAPALACSVLPLLFQGALVILLFDGFHLTALWPMVAVTVYAGFFSRNLMFICGSVNIAAVLLSELIRKWEIYSVLVVPPEFRLLPLAMVSISTAFVIGYLLRRNLMLTESVFGFLGSANRGQLETIWTIRRIQPEIDAAAREVKLISSKIAAQSTVQAASTSEMSATMGMMQENAGVTASKAEQTRVIANQTRATSQENSERLKRIEQSFDNVVTTISTAAKEVTELAGQMEKIEEILDFNRKIGEQIKVLAINSAIEADRAGEYGQGFGAVAAEFKNMIRDTERNLSSSSDLLQTIRDRAKESSLFIIEGSEQLSRFFDDLRVTSNTVAQNTERFYITAKQVAKISDAARLQEEGVAEVSSTMAAIDHATAELNDSATSLLDSVSKILASQLQLEQVLASD